MPFTYTYTDCDFCGVPGPEEEKSTIRYEEEVAFGLCPRCFAKWKQKPDEAQIVSVGKGQEGIA